MPDERLAVYTTVFPNALPFLAEFTASLAVQTDQRFDLWVGLDRLEPEDLEAAFEDLGPVNWVPSEPRDTFATVRERAWTKIAATYSGVVLVDSDDVLHPERVARARAGLAADDVYACALDLVRSDGSPFDVILEVDDVEDWTRFLARWNVFGLSNTAYRSKMLATCLPLPRSVGVIDWHLVSRALDGGASLVFDRTPLMNYRLYPASTSKILPPFTSEDVKSGTRHVLRHYRNLLPHLRRDGRLRELGARRQKEVECFRDVATSVLEAYVSALNAREQEVYVWWELVASEEMREIWSP